MPLLVEFCPIPCSAWARSSRLPAQTPASVLIILHQTEEKQTYQYSWLKILYNVILTLLNKLSQLLFLGLGWGEEGKWVGCVGWEIVFVKYQLLNLIYFGNSLAVEKLSHSIWSRIFICGCMWLLLLRTMMWGMLRGWSPASERQRPVWARVAVFTVVYPLLFTGILSVITQQPRHHDVIRN